MRLRTLAAAVIVGITTAGPLGAESQDFHLLSQSVSIDRTNQVATFRLTFDQPPSFVAVSRGQIKAFQYEIEADSASLSDPFGTDDLDAIVRGGEIWIDGKIPVREAVGDGGEDSGGWGPIRALLDFDVEGNTLSFSTAWSDLGDLDGRFRYRLITTDMGEITGSLTATTAAPLPSPAWSGIAVLGAILLVRPVRRLLASLRQQPA